MNDLKARAEERFAAVEKELRRLSVWMYEHPEIAHSEHEASRRLAAFLSSQGFEVEHPAYGIATSFVARAGDDGPEMVICAEYDALPGVGHACGHNIIAAAACGAGAALVPLASELGFRLTVLGTPAEERIGGKVDLIEAGAFEGSAAAMMIHPATEDTVDKPMLAIAHLVVEFTGKDAHASAFPWEGRNALDAFVHLYNSVSMYRQHLKPTDKFHGIITDGGDAPNIIPSHTRSEWYVRAGSGERLDELMGRFRAMVDAAASATGCDVTLVREGHVYDAMISDPVMAELFTANAAALGRSMSRGAEREVGATGSTDMGNVSQVVPSLHPMIRVDADGAVNHQPEFAAHTITEDGHGAMRDGALAMAWTVIDIAAGDRWDELGPSRNP